MGFTPALVNPTPHWFTKSVLAAPNVRGILEIVRSRSFYTACKPIPYIRLFEFQYAIPNATRLFRRGIIRQPVQRATRPRKDRENQGHPERIGVTRIIHQEPTAGYPRRRVVRRWVPQKYRVSRDSQARPETHDIGVNRSNQQTQPTLEGLQPVALPSGAPVCCARPGGIAAGDSRFRVESRRPEQPSGRSFACTTAESDLGI